MSNRIKSSEFKPVQINTRAEAEACARALTEYKLRRQSLKTQMDSKLTDIKENYEGLFAEADVKIQREMTRLEDWAVRNPQEFKDKKSLDLLHGDAGWRINPPSLKTLRGWTWARVLEEVRERLPWGVRTKEEVDKVGILSRREELGNDGLKRPGLAVIQEEEFFYDPHMQPAETREVAP
jgi:phage host-nuclease inhibitor protein Gam